MKLKTFTISFFLVFSFVFLTNPGKIFASAIPVAGKAKVLNTNNSYFGFTDYSSSVTLDTTSGNFSGYSFSEDVGWVAFGTADNPLGPVHINLANGTVTGKAKVINTGAYLDFTGYSSAVTMTSGVFSGYAFSEDVGWINFSDPGSSVNSCASVPVSGNHSITATACAFPGTVNGVDAGTGTANSAELTLGTGGSLTVLFDQTLAVGKLNLTGGTATIIDGGIMKIGTPIYYPDADSDGYPTSVTTTKSLTGGTGWARRGAGIDYNDGDGNIKPGTACGGVCSVNNTDGTCTAVSAGKNGLGTCQYCDGSSLSAVYMATGSDTYDDCGAIDCDGGATKYYSGWVSNVCYYMLDVSAANATCDGAGACKTTAVECAASTQGASTGSTWTTCHTMTGCSGTTAPTLPNVSGFTDTGCAGTCAAYCSSGSCIATDTSAGTCTVATNARVASGGTGHCTSSSCVLDSKANGEVCSLGSECTSTFCVDGVCCASACTLLCTVCNNTCGAGVCHRIIGSVDPRNDCGTTGCYTGMCYNTPGCSTTDASFCAVYNDLLQHNCAAGYVCSNGSCQLYDP